MVRIVFLLGVSAALPAAAQAKSVSATMEVRLIIQPSCDVKAMPMVFAGRAGQPMDAASEVRVVCNDETPVAVRLDGGLNGDDAIRRLAGERGLVPYAIYADQARSLEWSVGEPLTGTAGLDPLVLAAYGRIDGAATADALGGYTDSVVVTVDF